MERIDILNLQDEYISHTHQITLWPRQWQDFNDARDFIWEFLPLTETERQNIPSGPGIYSILIQPNIARHPCCSYLMYLGKAKSLRTRFNNYLNAERRDTGRPMIYRMLNRYSDYLIFCFTQVPIDELDVIEDSLLAAYMPPNNKQLPAGLNDVRGAFQ